MDLISKSAKKAAKKIASKEARKEARKDRLKSIPQKVKRYLKISDYYKERYGEKVYKLPIALPVTCPNRDGNCGTGGCIFCGEIGAGYENLPSTMTVQKQIEENINHIGPKYNASKFIPYYQNFTNTYLPIETFRQYIIEGCVERVVGIAIATRPDCISDAYLDVLREIQTTYEVDIYLELGMQTVNYDTLQTINRGHTLAEYIDAMIRIKKYGFQVCTHMILNLPWDTMADTIEGAKIISALGSTQVKLHALYLVKDTPMARMYENNEFTMITAEEYVDRVVTFLQYLDPQIVLQRLVGRAPEENTIFTNWSMGWWRIQDMIDMKMEENDYYQGDCFNYLNGKSLRKFEHKESYDGTDL